MTDPRVDILAEALVNADGLNDWQRMSELLRENERRKARDLLARLDSPSGIGGRSCV